jgi:hypothetical protein
MSRSGDLSLDELGEVLVPIVERLDVKSLGRLAQVNIRMNEGATRELKKRPIPPKKDVWIFPDNVNFWEHDTHCFMYFGTEREAREQQAIHNLSIVSEVMNDDVEMEPTLRNMVAWMTVVDDPEDPTDAEIEDYINGEDCSVYTMRQVYNIKNYIGSIAKLHPRQFGYDIVVE